MPLTGGVWKRIRRLRFLTKLSSSGLGVFALRLYSFFYSTAHTREGKSKMRHGPRRSQASQPLKGASVSPREQFHKTCYNNGMGTLSSHPWPHRAVTWGVKTIPQTQGSVSFRGEGGAPVSQTRGGVEDCRICMKTLSPCLAGSTARAVGTITGSGSTTCCGVTS